MRLLTSLSLAALLSGAADAQTPPSDPANPPGAPKLDPAKIKALLDKADRERAAQQRDLPAQNLISSVPRPALNFDHLIAQLSRCWVAPMGAPQRPVELRVRFHRDGSLDGAPVVLTPASEPSLRRLVESAVQAVAAASRCVSTATTNDGRRSTSPSIRGGNPSAAKVRRHHAPVLRARSNPHHTAATRAPGPNCLKRILCF